MTTDDARERMLEAIAEASEEVGLDAWYRACVEPLMSLDEARYPRCCGSGCEPCSETLIEVAVRAKRKLAAHSSSGPQRPIRIGPIASS